MYRTYLNILAYLKSKKFTCLKKCLYMQDMTHKKNIAKRTGNTNRENIRRMCCSVFLSKYEVFEDK